MVEEINGSSLGVEDIADLISHQIINGLHIQFGGQPFLHTVNDRKFGSSLFRLAEQMLGLIEQTRVFESRAHAACKRLQEAYIRFTKRMFTLHITQDKYTACPVIHHQRHEYG